MHGYRGLTGRRGPGHGERLLFSMALVVVSLLWITQDMAAWATAACAVGAAGGAVGVCYFGWRYIRARENSQ
ncbi:hypothetical protein GCM10010256_22540 [Streptomyces coeruleorubidus]|uniref:DUF2530 domain-containing protein n=1 Tax=Streptomyces coeruleorubidus TaxID=116188 RepID=A0A5J6I5X7_STRC4|nr:hypothetical protein CP976_22565 [Streptomyces coeruleorubidus]GGT64337.1 hypothetical protein GCM10010256_22540 [Streptomyces coeruleorubidus]